jgi:glycosyltransferase involved in cell wall biosynthesis
MNIPSPYQEDLFRRLALRNDVDLHVIYHSRLGQERRRIGWEVTLKGYEYTFLNHPKPLTAAKYAIARRGQLHIVNGIWALPSFTIALIILATIASNPCFVYTEASDPTRRRSAIRLLVRNGIGKFIARCPHVYALAVSSLAVAQLKAMGFPEERIYPFGYFRECPPCGEFPAPSSGNKMVYVGQLIQRKGVDILLEAIAPLWHHYPDLSLDIIGEGPERRFVERYIQEHPYARITLFGPVSSAKIFEAIAGHDLLILPSRFDGWGIVVNEALALGVPVVASNACGAVDLIVHGRNGYVFKSGDPSSLRACLIEFMSLDREEKARMRQSALRTSELIRMDVIVEYLIRCIRHAIGSESRPEPPWELTE